MKSHAHAQTSLFPNHDISASLVPGVDRNGPYIDAGRRPFRIPNRFMKAGLYHAVNEPGDAPALLIVNMHSYAAGVRQNKPKDRVACG